MAAARRRRNRGFPRKIGVGVPHQVLVSTFFAALFILTLTGAVAAQDGTGEDNLPRYWQIHAVLLTASTVFFVAAFGALWLRWLHKLDPLRLTIVKPLARAWYRMHVYLAMIGTVLGIGGVLSGYLMVDWAHKGTHLRIPHSYVGLAAAIVVSVPMIVGFLTRASDKRKDAVKWLHVVLGVVVIGLMLAGVFTGWSLE